MIKKYVIGLIISMLMIVIYIIFNVMVVYLDDVKTEEYVINLLERRSDKGISEETLNELKSIGVSSDEERNITPIIKDYISKIYEIVKAKKNGTEIKNYEDTIDLTVRGKTNIKIYGLSPSYVYDIADDITDDDIRLYNNDTLIAKIENKLQENIKYENGKWYISKDNSELEKIIKLPYNCVLVYREAMKVDKPDNLRIKKVTKINNISKDSDMWRAYFNYETYSGEESDSVLGFAKTEGFRHKIIGYIKDIMYDEVEGIATIEYIGKEN